ncbi:MAG: chemotaxis-specific protein-glutamate methyltransferase CheB [bacterium]
MIKVLIAEDSLVMQQHLTHILSSDPEIEIVGIANNGEEAIYAVEKLRPDVITMDWHMPKLDGMQATRIIMATNPTPIVIVTGSFKEKDVAFSFNMIEAGALAIIKKPSSIVHPDYKNEIQGLIQTLKLMSEIKLVKRISNIALEPISIKSEVPKIINKNSKAKIIAIGASTGGPLIIQKILSNMPKDIQVPILIVQHISIGFTKGFVQWLTNTTNFPLHIACDGECLLPGNGYIAPDNFHMGIKNGAKILLSNHELENGLRPSIAFLFRTVANVFGHEAIGVLLTGMGRDGAEELKLMKEKGAVTFAQDKESCVVYGMPGEAEKLNAATYILSPEEITKALIGLTKKMNGDEYAK